MGAICVIESLNCFNCSGLASPLINMAARTPITRWAFAKSHKYFHVAPSVERGPGPWPERFRIGPPCIQGSAQNPA